MREHRFTRSLLLAAIVALTAGLPSSADADDRAIAQQAFEEGRDLLARGMVAEACPKFAAAAQLSQTPGVRLNLAACYARLGKAASAWAKANEALSLAERAGDSAAASLAREQLSAIQPQLSYLTIVVATPTAPQNLEIVLDGEKVPASLWGSALPVDPGEHEVTARASGRKPSSTRTIVTGPGVRATVSVPVLLAAEESTLVAPSTQPSAEARGGWSRSLAHTLALVSAGVGIAGLGVGTVFGLEANAKKSDYLQHEAGGHCIDLQCVSLSKSAVTAAGTSTTAFIAGGALVAMGLVLWLTAPAKNPEKRGLSIRPTAGPQGLGARVAGSW